LDLVFCFATLISLILVPVIYRILEDGFGWFGIDEHWIAEVEEEQSSALQDSTTPSINPL